jgi:hypothetical protein
MYLKNYNTLTVMLIILGLTACSKHKDTAIPMPETGDAIVETLPSAAEPSSNEAGTTLNHVTQDNSGKTVLYWYDPMKADKHFNQPGKSPFMDMELIPKYAQDTLKDKKP